METKTHQHLLLREAEEKAAKLFSEIESRNLIRAGVTEKQINTEVYQLALDLFGIKKYWHKRIVRAGTNTLCPYRENPPDLTIMENDIIFFDFGPVFEDWEADYGRTYVLGNDPDKIRIKHDIETCWSIGKNHFMANDGITGSQLYEFVSRLAVERDWEFGQEHSGHLIGNFPHEKLHGEEIENYIHPNNHRRMRDSDKQGNIRDWILEIHFVDRKKEIGGFFEQLLT